RVCPCRRHQFLKTEPSRLARRQTCSDSPFRPPSLGRTQPQRLVHQVHAPGVPSSTIGSEALGNQANAAEHEHPGDVVSPHPSDQCPGDRWNTPTEAATITTTEQASVVHSAGDRSLPAEGAHVQLPKMTRRKRFSANTK